MFNYYIRWRHSKGYGVHSPFAFRLVEEVVNPDKRYGYYGYSEIKKKKGEISLACFILRLLSTLRIKKVISPSLPSPTLEVAIKCAATNIEKDSELDSGTLVLLLTNDHPEDLIEKAIAAGSTILILKPSSAIREFLENNLNYGVTFSDKKSVLTVARKEMAFVKYDILMRIV